MRVTLHDSRLAKETVALITVNIDPGMDIMAPVLTLLGEVQLTIDQGTTYVDAGASATDNADGDLTAKIVVSGEVDASTVGIHTLKYDVSDAAGNAAESVTRTVVVQKTSVTQTLSLIEGWNLISFYVEADDMRPARVLIGFTAQSSLQLCLSGIRFFRPIRVGASIQPQMPGNRSCRTSIPGDKLLCHLSLVSGTYNFFSSTSFNGSLPSISSASIRLSRAFSRWSSLSWSRLLKLVRLKS